MRIATTDITSITTAVRRHEAVLRYARYMLVYNLVIFLWAAIPQLIEVRSAGQLVALVTNWQFAGLVLGSVAGCYLLLAHRVWWAYAAIFLAQIAYYVVTPTPDKPIFVFSVALPKLVVTNPATRPLAPLATELAMMSAIFVYVMLVYVLYSSAWILKARTIPSAAYGRPPSLLEPLRPSRLLEMLLPGHRSQKVSPAEAALLALASLLFVTASMAVFYGIRRVQNAFGSYVGEIMPSCGQISDETLPTVIACIAGHYTWARAALDLGAPVAVAIGALIAANLVRRVARRRFIARLAERPVEPAGATLFLRAFRDDQVRIRRASRNLFSLAFDLGRTPQTLDELMLERLDGRGDLVAIGNPEDRKGAARQSPWGAQRLYVDNAEWQATAGRLAREAQRIILCVDASEGVKWEIAHVLANGHADKTLFVLNPSLDAATRRRLLAEQLAVPPAELAVIDVDRIIAVRVGAPDQRTLIVCKRPERDAYLVAARLAFAPEAATEL